MAVRIRLTRMGRMRRPFYRIGAFDSSSRRDGHCLEYLGFYDPLETTGQKVRLDKERIEDWIGRGAKPTETVASFLRTEGVTYKHSQRTRSRNSARSKKRQASRKARKKA